VTGVFHGRSGQASGPGSRHGRFPGAQPELPCCAADLHRVAALLMAAEEGADELPVVPLALREQDYGRAFPTPEEGRIASRAAGRARGLRCDG
jgi:hypothetical protein